MDDALPELTQLTPVSARILGSLAERAATTPDASR